MLLQKAITKLENYLLKKIDVDRTLPIQIDITNACNLRCLHCYHPNHSNQGSLSLNQWKAILDQYDALVKKLHFRPQIIVCGGEPLLSPLFNPILEHAASLGGEYRLTVLTNGTLTQRVDFDLIRRFKNPTFQISLDGHDAETHDFIRGKGSFQKSLEGISFLKSKNVKIELLAVLSLRTSPWIEKFFDLAASLQVDHMGFTRLIIQGYAEKLVGDGADRPLNAQELYSTFSEILKQSALSGVQTGTRGPLMHLLHPNLGSSPRFAEAIIVDYKGQMLASSRSRYALGDVLHEGLENLHLNHPIKKALRNGKIEVCGKCKYYQFCGGDRNAAYAESGNILAADPGCWLPTIGKQEVPYENSGNSRRSYAFSDSTAELGSYGS